MKFKKRKGDDYTAISVTDSGGDTLSFETVGADAMWQGAKKPALFAVTNGGVVELSRAKALKLAWAIIDELQPSGL